VSAGEDHFGVTTWRKKHVSFSGSSVKIKYKGKAGVDQEKIVTNSTIVKELKTICQNIKKNDELFPEVSANKVNEYLKPYKITAKDIRGFHANEEMKKALKKAKSKEKDVEKKRKEEFKKALEETAKLVGHTPNTLKNQYLVPSIEVDYMKSGKTSQASLSIRDN
jgi:DNA topoisomerase-1